MRYIVGIDLGTTNTAITYIDLAKAHLPLESFAIPQLVSVDRVESLPTLPSFCYLSDPGEWPLDALSLPWSRSNRTLVGQFAKSQGAKVPSRLIQSAKSWLSHAGANRRDRILPLEKNGDRLSPVEVSTLYLDHLRQAWNASLGRGDPLSVLEEQEIVLTVPASFDEVARGLTVEAAKSAGFRHVTLLEEPQAALYSWIARHEKEWEEYFRPGDVILVCDVGGGTTDFSLIEINLVDEKLTFQRMAVGKHLLLGGDNMDRSIAHYLENKLSLDNQSLDTHQWHQLVAESRLAKESLFHPSHPVTAYSIVLQGSGSSVVKGSRGITFTLDEAKELILQGFFPIVERENALDLIKMKGIRTMGLPYENEPAITKHLAQFLNQAGYFSETSRGVDYLLFNGGTMKPPAFQQALVKALEKWYPGKKINLLPSANLDLAVTKGAAYYGKVRRGAGVEIQGGLPRTYYLRLEVKEETGESKETALTLLPRGVKEGEEYLSSETFFLRANAPAAFQLLTSTTRLTDGAGTFQEIKEEEMQPLPPIQTLLRFGKQASFLKEQLVSVQLGIKLTPIGTIEIWLESKQSDHRWSLEFQVRSESGQEIESMGGPAIKDQTYASDFTAEAENSLQLFFKEHSLKSSQLMDKLEKDLGLPRKEWSISLNRKLADSVLIHREGRIYSSDYAARWWNLIGFFLRPGFGYPLDDHRMKELWKIVLADFNAKQEPEVFLQQCICLRRIAGGLSKGQQMQLVLRLMEDLFQSRQKKIDSNSYSEKMRALASFERIDQKIKIQLGEAIIQKFENKQQAKIDYWALSRLGARHLFYGSAANVIPKEICSKWLERLLSCELEENDQKIFLFVQMARKTDHRELNIDAPLLEKIAQHLPGEAYQKLISYSWNAQENEQVFGEALPSGLILDLTKK